MKIWQQPRISASVNTRVTCLDGTNARQRDASDSDPMDYGQVRCYAGLFELSPTRRDFERLKSSDAITVPRATEQIGKKASDFCANGQCSICFIGFGRR